MPTVNFFVQSSKHKIQLSRKIAGIKAYIARELTCSSIKLDASEVSVRFINAGGSGMIGDVEVEITAHTFDERIEKQDEICFNIRKYLLAELSDTDVRVWLLLPQLGHSWD